MGKLVDSQTGVSRQKITFKLASLFFVTVLALFLFMSVFSSSFSLSERYIGSGSGSDLEFEGLHRGDAVDGDEGEETESGGEESIGFDLLASVAGCADNRGERHGCLMDGRVYSYSQGGPWAALMKQPGVQDPTHAHGSNLLILPSGDLLCTWFSGVEGENSVAIVLARLPSESTEWTDPIVVSVTEGQAAQNPVLFYDAEDDVLFLFHTSQVAFRGQGTSHVMELRSSDRGFTWKSPRTVFKQKGAYIRNQVVVLPSKRWLMPMYYTPDGYGHFETHYSATKLSKDRGKTWREYGMTYKGQWLVQPSVVLGKRGLIAFFRNRHADWVFTSVSADEGRTWSPARKTALPSNNSGLQALMLRSGSLVLVFNNRSGARRYPLSIALSEDEGVTWRVVRDIEPGDPVELPPDGEYSYPSVVQSPDEFIHVSYTYLRQTIKYIRVNEDWIRKGGTVGEFLGGYQQS